MNADELRSRRREIMESAAKRKRGIDECLSDLESLDAVANKQRPAWYVWLVDFEMLLRLLKAAEGRPEAQTTVAQMMIAALQRLIQSCPKGESA